MNFDKLWKDLGEGRRYMNKWTLAEMFYKHGLEQGNVKMECISTWLVLLPLNIITRVSIKYEIDTCLLAAIVATESMGNSNATRYEAHYKWLVKPDFFARLNRITKDTEEVHQRTSWGLLQIMGANIRDLGYNDSLLKMADPETALNYGAKFFKGLLNKYDSVEDAVSSYNQGSPRKRADGLYCNYGYVEKVMGKYKALDKILGTSQ